MVSTKNVSMNQFDLLKFSFSLWAIYVFGRKNNNSWCSGSQQWDNFTAFGRKGKPVIIIDSMLQQQQIKFKNGKFIIG